MLWELLQWALPKISEIKSQILTLNLTASNILIILYLLTCKRTYILGASFLICELSGMLYGFGVYDSSRDIYDGYLLIHCYFATIQVMSLSNERIKFIKVLFFSSAFIILFLYAGYDAENYPTTKTDFYVSYPSILMLLHVCLILSFYNVRRILNSLGNKLSRFVRLLRSNYTIEYFCYTISYRFKPRF